MNKNEILCEIKRDLKKLISDREAEAVVFSDDMDVELIDSVIKICISSKAIGVRNDRRDVCNMQDDAAAFEGWAFVIYTYFGKKKNLKVQLALKEEAWEKVQNFMDMGKYLGERGHYYRFLYRALRFSEQYSWFYLEEKLDGVVRKFHDYLKGGIIFTNNYPNGEKEISITGSENENHIEDLFSDVVWQESVEGKKICEKQGIQIYRQLPVGLFAEKKRTENAIFTGKKSAIDLWCHNDSDITIFELKWKNKMIGIITELFFYCNYMKDMYGKRDEKSQYRFNSHMVDLRRIKNKEKYRGYYNICGRKFEQINGYMLYDKGNLHQAITEKLLKEINDAIFSDVESSIKYGLIEYTVVNDELKIEQIRKYD